jgi:teichuronic acid biosynthesis protein TuaE
MNYRNIIFLLVLVSAVIDPLIPPFSFGPINITFFKIIILLSFSFYLIKISIEKRTLVISKSNIYFLVFFSIWLIYQFLSISWVEDTNGVIRGIFYFIFYLMLMIVLYLTFNKYKDLSFSFKVVYILFFMMIFIGLFELITGIHFNTSRYSDPLAIERQQLNIYSAATSTFYNENNYSLFLLICFPVTLFANKYLTGWKRIINYTMLILTLLIVYLNGAYAVLLGIILQLMFYIFWNKKINYKKLLLSIFGFFVVGGIITFSNLLENFQGIFNEIFNGYGSNYIRLNLYLSGLSMLENSRFLGVGIDNFQQGLENINLYVGNIIDPHNLWIEIIAEHGIIIFLMFVAFYIKLIRNLLCLKYKSIYLENLGKGLSLSLIGLIVGSIGPSGMFYYWPMWFLFGICIAFLGYNRLARSEL